MAVVLADTETVPFGTMDFATGSLGVETISRMFRKEYLFGKPNFGGIDLVVHELTAASALVFGQTKAGIPVAVIRGYEYGANYTASVSNTLLLQAGDDDMPEAVKATMRATSCARGLKQRLLLRIASWFV